MEILTTPEAVAPRSVQFTVLDGTSHTDRCALLRNGYEPIPICGKSPRWPWRGRVIEEALLAEIENNSQYADHQSTGLRTGKLSVVDIDIRGEVEINAVQNAIFGVLGHSDMQRVGSKGVAICYHNPTPCMKITVSGRRSPSDELRPLIEFLGDGQQMAAYGLHPDTQRAYEWPYAYDCAEPLFRPLQELTMVSPDKLMAAASAVASVLTDLGYVDVSIKGLANLVQEPSKRTREPISDEWLRAALAAIPPSCPREEWLRVIFAVKDALVIPNLDDGARVELLDRWSSGELTGADAPDSYAGYEDIRRTYESARSGKPSAVGVGTLLRIAEAYGYTGGTPHVSLFELAETDTMGISTQPNAAGVADEGRWGKLIRCGEDIRSMPPAKFLVFGWLRDVGVHNLLAERGTGKTVVAVDLALRLATNKRWMGEEVLRGCYCVYLCGEDKENTAGHVLAWCERENGGHVPDRFLFVEDTPDLTNKTDCDALVKHLQSLVPGGSRVVLFVDTWQRATSKAKEGQNSDRDMAEAMENLETLARKLKGPVIGCFHPPKADKTTTHGSAITENASTAIWHLSRPHGDQGANDLELKVTRIKGPGLGNYKRLRLEQVELNQRDETGRPTTGAVVTQTGGTSSSLMEYSEQQTLERNAVLSTLRELIAEGIRVVRSNGNGQKPRDIAKAVKEKLGYELKPRRVLDILNEAERDGLVRYVAADKNQRVQAGFRFAEDVAAESTAESQPKAIPKACAAGEKVAEIRAESD